MMIQEQKEDLKNQAITSNRMAITVPGLVIKQHKVDWYAVKIRGKDLMGAGINLEVDEWTMKKLSRVKDQGYQRVLQSKHANEFAAFIENENNFSPTAIYVNVRPLEKPRCIINEKRGGFVDVTFKNGLTLYIVDGQHRLRGMSTQIDWSLNPNIELLLTLTHGLTKNEEIEQFITMNKLQASVKTDLAERTVSEMANTDEEYLTKLATKKNIIFKDIEFLQVAIDVMDKMYRNTDSVWYKRLLMPNQSKAKGGSTGVSTKSFTDSLKDLLQRHETKVKKKVEPSPLGDIVARDIATHLDNFWKGLSLVNKEMFKERNVCKYAIQQTIGTMVMHQVLFKIHRNASDMDEILELTASKWKALLNVPKLNDPKMWDREYDDKTYRRKMGIDDDGKATGGYFTRQGTNKKSFGLMANEIFGQITRNPEWSKYKRKMKK